MGYFPPHRAQTTHVCPRCRKARLEIVRSCHEAYMHCPACHSTYALRDYIAKADKAMEEFLENCYLDRL